MRIIGFARRANDDASLAPPVVAAGANGFAGVASAWHDDVDGDADGDVDLMRRLNARLDAINDDEDVF
jgi:hypothetical protein